MAKLKKNITLKNVTIDEYDVGILTEVDKEETHEYHIFDILSQFIGDGVEISITQQADVTDYYDGGEES